MNPAQLLSRLDRISEAPGAVSRLRCFILDLAVRGKLVEQDPREEPASELLKRIQAKKIRLVSAGEMKKAKPLPVIEEDEIPFAIPANWRWVRLNDITSYLQRGKSPKYATGEGLPVISQKCVQWGGLELESAKLITRESIEGYEPIRFLRSGDLLWNSTGTGTIGRIIKVKEPLPKLVCDSHVTVVRCLEVDAEYVRSWLRSDHVYAVIEDRAAGSTNQVELTSQLAKNQIAPLPPLAEQQRIVAKVDELMALCDRLEAAQVERESRRDRLAAASLHRLNNGADLDAFRDHARFYFNHLPCLTTRSEHIKQLRQTILNLAVSGKLVSQDPTDEPASELLKRIEQAKTQLIAAKELRQVSPIANSIDRRLEISIPRSWAWAKCENILFVTKLAGFEYTKHFELCSEGDIPVIRAQNVRPWRIERNNLLYIDNKTSESLARSALTKPCILVTFIGAGIGDVAFFNEKLRWHLAPNVAKAEVFIGCEDLLDLRYLVLFLNSPFGRAEIFKHIKSTAQPSISMGTIRDIDLALPPLAEQHRIVAKVDGLMALCDRLETQLTTTQTESRRLLEAVLHDALTC
jgi:type I restriction enzyme S subunit